MINDIQICITSNNMNVYEFCLIAMGFVYDVVQMTPPVETDICRRFVKLLG